MHRVHHRDPQRWREHGRQRCKPHPQHNHLQVGPLSVSDLKHIFRGELGYNLLLRQRAYRRVALVLYQAHRQLHMRVTKLLESARLGGDPLVACGGKSLWKHPRHLIQESRIKNQEFRLKDNLTKNFSQRGMSWLHVPAVAQACSAEPYVTSSRPTPYFSISVSN